jgi:hypothetical protein
MKTASRSRQRYNVKRAAGRWQGPAVFSGDGHLPSLFLLHGESESIHSISRPAKEDAASPRLLERVSQSFGYMPSVKKAGVLRKASH